MKRFYTVKEVSKLLGFSTNTVYKYLEEGKIKATRLGKEGRFRIPASEVAKISPMSSGLDTTESTQDGEHEKSESSILTKTTGAPSLFDWFTFILAIALGASQFLFPTYVLDVNFDKYALLIKILKSTLLVFGSLLIFDDLFGKKKARWHDLIHIGLAASFVSISLVFLKTSYFPQLIGYSSVALTLIITRFWKMNEYGKFLLLVNLNLLFFGFAAVLAPSQSGLDFISFWIADNKLAFIILWIFSLLICFRASVQSMAGRKFFIFALTAAVCLGSIGYSIFAFSFGYWERAVYLVVLSAFSLLFPFWRSFEIFTVKSRQQLLLAFFWVNALFAIGGITLFFLGRSFETYVVSGIKENLDGGAEITRAFVKDAQDKIVSFSQDRQLISILEKGGGQSAEMQELLKDFYLTEKGGFRRIVFSSAEGINTSLYPELPESIGVDISETDYFRLAKEGRRVVNSGIVKPRTSGVTPAVLITSPIYSRSGQFLGVLAGSLDLKELSNRLNQIKLGTRGDFKVIDDKYEFIIHPDSNKVLTPAPEGSICRQSLGSEGIDKAYNSEGVLSLMAHKPISMLGWGIVAEEPLVESFGQYNVLGFVIFVILVMAGIGSLILIIKMKNVKGS